MSKRAADEHFDSEHSQEHKHKKPNEESTEVLSQQFQIQLNQLVSHYGEELCCRERTVNEKEKRLRYDEEHLLRQVEEQRKQMVKDLEEREERISLIERKVASSTSVASKLGKNQMIKLNVGGKIFATNLSTITSVKETFFTGYFNDHFDPKPEEEDNAFFIDRPFEQFQLILNYLRGIDIKQKIKTLNESDLIDFIEEVVYYQITPIYDLLPQSGIRILRTKFGIHHKLPNKECLRFVRAIKTSNNWKNYGTCDSLDFRTSDTCYLSGIQLYAASNCDYTVELSIIRRDTSQEIYENSFTFSTHLEYFDYMLHDEVIIEEGYGMM